MNGLKVKGEGSRKSSDTGPNPLSSTIRASRTADSGLFDLNKGYQLVFNPQPPNCSSTDDLTVTSLTGHTVPVRKMEHLSRVRAANFGISTMDSNFVTSGGPEPTLVIEKPHFILCGLPIGSKEIDHHLYVSETRVGNFKTSAKALYQARRGLRSAKAHSEPMMRSPEKDMINHNTNLPDVEDRLSQRTIPPIPPTTPVHYAHFTNMMKPRTPAGGRLPSDLGQFHGSIPSVEMENAYHIPSDSMIKHKKLTLLSRERSNDSFDLPRETSTMSTHSIRSMETVSESVINNGLTVTSGKGTRLLATRSSGKTPLNKVNYNNPYRNTKYKERMALSSNKKFEFNNLDNYIKYQKQHNVNGKNFMTRRAVVRIPKPCSDTFLLQMMYDLNRPAPKKSPPPPPPPAASYSDIARTRDLEEFVQTRTSSSLSKTQSNIDKYMNTGITGSRLRTGAKSAKSSKSMRSSNAATETIVEEVDIPDAILDQDIVDIPDGKR